MDIAGFLDSKLKQVLGKEDASSVRAPTKVTPEMDAVAKARGFPNYLAMEGFYRQRQDNLGRNSGSSLNQGIEQGMEDAMALHPKRLFEYTADKIKKATKGR